MHPKTAEVGCSALPRRQERTHHRDLAQWCTDVAGAMDTAQFRFVAVDRRGPAPEGQS